jgi:KTSC domain
MTRVEVESSNVKSVGYDSATETLEVEFHDKADGTPGAIWQYRPVPRNVYGAMMLTGASVGKIFHREVKINPLVNGVRIEEPATP